MQEKFNTRIAGIVFFCLIPLTIVLGVFMLNDRKFYFISLLIILLSMVPLVIKFERRRPEARELILLASLTAIGVAGRTAFFMVPQFKPVIAIIIIVGICFGGEIGFLLGALIAFISNFFFGMGPFTPWQMFAMGFIGNLAGNLHKKGYLGKSKKHICIFGALSTFFIYGLIMDFSSLLLWINQLSKELIITTFLAGLPFNIMHSASTVIFLFLLWRPMMDKLDRIKKKYGILDQGM